MKSPWRQRNFLGIGLAVLSVIFLARLFSFDFLDAFSTFGINHAREIALVACLEGTYVAVKSFAWMVAYNDAGISVSWGTSLKLFLVSAFIDTVTFPTVVAGDGFKLAYLRSAGSSRVLQSIVELRSGALLAYVLVASIVLSWGFKSVALMLLTIFFLPPLTVAALSRKRAVISWSASLRVLRQLLFNAVTLSVDGMRFLVLASIMGLVPSLYGLGSYIVSQLGGVLTGIPLGIGGREVVLTALLHQSLSLKQVSFIVIGLRCTAELPCALMGWLLAGKEVWAWRRGAAQEAARTKN